MMVIADLCLDWQSDFSDFAKAFCTSSFQSPVMKLSFEANMPNCYGVGYIDKPFAHLLKTERGDVLAANSDWSEVTSYGLLPSDRDFALPLAAVCSRLSYFGVLLAHASLVSYEGEGVLFLGASGIGKTTQAELWQKHLGAKIINGDKALLRNVDGRFYAYGLPWKGSSEYCLNEKVPLKSIVVLRQSKKNTIKWLDTQVTEYTMPHFFFPHWDGVCLNNALDTFDDLVKNVPVSLLECRPDEDAVKLAYNMIFG